MTKARGITVDILNDAAAFMFIICLSILPAFMWLDRPYTIALLIIPYAVCFMLRRMIKHLSLFLVLHAALLCTVFLPDIGLYQRLIYLALMLVTVIHSIVKRLRHATPDISAPFVVFQTVCAGAGAICAERVLQRPAAAYAETVTVIVIFMCYIVFHHMQNLDETLTLVTRTTVQPVRAILSVNNRIILTFAAIACLAGALSSFVRPDRVLALLGGGILALLRFIFSHINGSPDTPPLPPPEELPAQQPMPPFMDQPPGQPWIVWVLLGKVFYYLAMAAPFIIAAAIIVYLCIRIYRRFYEKVRTDDEIEIVPHDKLSVEAIKAIKSFFLPLSGIRRHFYKKIKRYIGKGIPIKPSDTPEEMTSKISEEDISRLTEVYQEVRYK